jgi:Spy/CpxP family protein refolding chaperone
MHKSLGFVFAAMLVAAPVSLSAQREGGGGAGRPGGMGMRGGNMAELVLQHKADLKLTDDQVKKLKDLEHEAKEVQEKNKPLMEEMRASGKSMRDMTDADREHYRPLMEAMRTLNTELMQILTPEQLETLRTFAPMGGRGPGGPGGAGARPQR